MLRCPCCPANGALPDAGERAGDRRLLTDVLGEDEDGLASVLADLDR